MYCRRTTRNLVRPALSWVMSLIQLLRSINPPRLVQPVRARTHVNARTRPNPRPSFRFTLIFANQLFITIPPGTLYFFIVIWLEDCCFYGASKVCCKPVSAVIPRAERFL